MKPTPPCRSIHHPYDMGIVAHYNGVKQRENPFHNPTARRLWNEGWFAAFQPAGFFVVKYRAAGHRAAQDRFRGSAAIQEPPR